MVDADQFPVLPKIYKVSSFPTVVLFKAAQPQHYTGVHRARDIDTYIRMVKVVNKDGSIAWVQDEAIFGDTRLTGDRADAFMDKIMEEAAGNGDTGEVEEAPASAAKPAFLNVRTH